jgi:quinol monooxygenase YgiN
MFVLHAHITVFPGREAAFEAAARALAIASTTNEPGLRRYEYSRCEEPGTYLAELAFADFDAFIEHQASQHHVVIGAAMRELIDSLRLERVEPVAGCSPLAPHPGELDPTSSFGAVDEEELDRRRADYRGRYPQWGATR